MIAAEFVGPTRDVCCCPNAGARAQYNSQFVPDCAQLLGIGPTVALLTRNIRHRHEMSSHFADMYLLEHQKPLFRDLRINMLTATSAKNRNTYRWPGIARELAQSYASSRAVEGILQHENSAFSALVTKIASVSGNPRSACLRFVRRLGVKKKRNYHPWTIPEQQRLLDLMASRSVEEVAVQLRRSPRSIRSMLHRLGASARMGKDWFTKHTLAKALHIGSDEVQKWIDRGWLKTRTLQTNGLKRQIIDAHDFCSFCKQYRLQIIGRRLNPDRLNFVQTFVFPPSHTELLPVRNAKKEQAAFDAQIRDESATEKELRASA